VLNFVQQPRADKTRLLHDGGGLYLAHDKRGGLSWLYKYRFEGKARTLGLGPWPEVKLASARRKHATARERLKSDHIDPLAFQSEERAERRAAAASAMTFKQAAEAWIKAHSAGWGPKTILQRENMLARFAYPTLGDLNVKSVDVNLVVKVLDQDVEGRRLWVDMAETGRKLRGHVEAILGWAAARNLRSIDNPARWAILKHLLPAHDKTGDVEHHAALSYRDARAFLAAVRALDGSAARALEFTLLTATRTTEVLAATWGEVDLEEKTWTIPHQRKKTGKKDKEVHRVPLSKAALAILTDLKPKEPKPGDYLFPGLTKGRPLSNMAMLKVLERMERTDLTVHGLRSTFRDWGAETTNFSRELLEKALGHIVGDETERAYQRGDLLEKRRKLMEAWANFCTAPPAKPKKEGVA
jgi:integrase